MKSESKSGLKVAVIGLVVISVIMLGLYISQKGNGKTHSHGNGEVHSH